MQEYLGLLIAVARRRIKQAVMSEAAPHGLAPQQFWTLVALHERPGLSQAELVELVRADAPTMSRAIAALKSRKLLRLEPDPTDRRRSRVFLTAGGERLAREVVPVATGIREAVVSGMSAAEVAAMRRGLLRVIASLDAYGERPRRGVRA